MKSLKIYRLFQKFKLEKKKTEKSIQILCKTWRKPAKLLTKRIEII